ncbi:MAG: trypsin-like peptidase domain-containing protein, partial [Verrucomicrobia bacterium]|nr:trypsin-like peptidase domain-containing protein [Verrucomicrobiota bacterium]
MALFTQISLIIASAASDQEELTSLAFWLKGLAGLVVGIPLLFTPTIIARYRNHPRKDWIFALNFFLGWTVVGWLVLLLKSLGPKDPIRSTAEYRRRYPLPGPKTPDGTVLVQQSRNASGAVVPLPQPRSPSPSNPTIIASAILGGALIIGLAIFGSVRVGYPARNDAEKSHDLVTVKSAASPALSLNTRPDSIVNKAKAAIVEIIASDANWSPIRRGTDFFITADGELLTNFHVIDGAAHISAQTENGAIFIFERFITGSPDSDVALLKFRVSDAPFLEIGKSINAVEGETVLVIGNPEGLQGTVSSGIISSFRENRSYIQVTAPISPGSSGSPVLDETGQVIGMATLTYKEGQNLNFAISAEAIRNAISIASNDELPRAYVDRIPEDAPPEVKADYAKRYFDRAAMEAQNMDYEAAITDYTEAIRLEPDCAEAYLKLGNLYSYLRVYSNAILSYGEAIRLKPNDPVGYNSRGEAYGNLKQYDKAIADFSEAIRLKPDDVDAYWDRSIAYRVTGRSEAADADFKKAKQLGL